LLAPINWILAIGGFVALLGLNAYPCCVGFAAGRFFREQAESKTYRRNVDHWLGEWEARAEDELPDEVYDLRRLANDPQPGDSADEP
jgi:hypothetical protein